MLSQLLQIKEMREQSAFNQVKSKSALLNQANNQLTKAKATLTDYIAWRQQEEQRLYDQLTGQTIPLKKLEEHKISIALLRAKDARLEEDVQQSRLIVQQAKEALQTARELHFEAQKTVEKSTVLNNRMEAQRLAEKDALEDKEMEEFTVKDSIH